MAPAWSTACRLSCGRGSSRDCDRRAPHAGSFWSLRPIWQASDAIASRADFYGDGRRRDAKRDEKPNHYGSEPSSPHTGTAERRSRLSRAHTRATRPPRWSRYVSAGLTDLRSSQVISGRLRSSQVVSARLSSCQRAMPSSSRLREVTKPLGHAIFPFPC